MKKTIIFAIALAAGPQGALAQLPSFFPAHHYLVDTWYPLVSYSGRGGFLAGGFFGIVHPLDFAADDFRPPHKWAVSLDGSVATKGSWHLTLNGSFPVAVPGWRFSFKLTTRRNSRDNYFGLGNNPDFDSRNLPGAAEDLNWADRYLTSARGEAQKYVSSNFRVLAGFNAERWSLTPISPTSQLGMDFANGLDPLIGIGTDDVVFRIGVVYDSRSDEVSPRSGMLLEAIIGTANAGVIGDLSYRRTMVSAAGYLPVGNRMVFAGRALAQNIAGDQSIGSFYLIESEKQPFRGIGGGRSHRALPDNALLGPGKLMFNFDVRYDILEYPTFLPVTLVGWMDAGRVFFNESFRLTLDEMKVGFGAGLFVQIGRSGIIGLSTGTGPGGMHTNLHTRWPF